MTSSPRVEGALRLFRKSVLKQAKVRNLFRHLPAAAGKVCLDLGSDNGVVSYLLRGRGGRWASADLAPKAVAAIRSLVGPEVCQTDGTHLPFRSASLDVVVIIDMLEHLRDDRACLQEMARILKPGGELLINTPHAKPKSLVRPLREALGLTDEWHGHVRPGYTLGSLRPLLDGSFEIVGASTYSKAFSELLDVALNFAYARKKGSSGPETSKGTVVTSADLGGDSREFRLLSVVYPALWLFSKLDALCAGTEGYYLIVRARKTARSPAR